MNNFIMMVNNRFRKLAEDCNPEALTMLKEYGIENGTKIEILYDGRTHKGELLVAGEDLENEPVIWFQKGGGKKLIPIFEAVMMVNLERADA